MSFATFAAATLLVRHQREEQQRYEDQRRRQRKREEELWSRDRDQDRTRSHGSSSRSEPTKPQVNERVVDYGKGVQLDGLGDLSTRFGVPMSADASQLVLSGDFSAAMWQARGLKDFSGFTADQRQAALSQMVDLGEWADQVLAVPGVTDQLADMRNRDHTQTQRAKRITSREDSVKFSTEKLRGIWAFEDSYKDVDRARERLQDLISSIGVAETAEKVKADPDILGGLKGMGVGPLQNEERKDALKQVEWRIVENLETIDQYTREVAELKEEQAIDQSVRPVDRTLLRFGETARNLKTLSRGVLPEQQKDIDRHRAFEAAVQTKDPAAALRIAAEARGNWDPGGSWRLRGHGVMGLLGQSPAAQDQLAKEGIDIAQFSGERPRTYYDYGR